MAIIPLSEGRKGGVPTMDRQLGKNIRTACGKITDFNIPLKKMR